MYGAAIHQPGPLPRPKKVPGPKGDVGRGSDGTADKDANSQHGDLLPLSPYLPRAGRQQYHANDAGQTADSRPMAVC